MFVSSVSSALWKGIKKQRMNNWWSGRVEARKQKGTASYSKKKKKKEIDYFIWSTATCMDGPLNT